MQSWSFLIKLGLVIFTSCYVEKLRYIIIYYILFKDRFYIGICVNRVLLNISAEGF